jgi:APA family basic amino acid/polyamine antiporter
MTQQIPDQTGLRRSLSLVHITLYGLGTTIGAGIYALIGELAGTAGLYAPVCFLIASVLVAFTALSFAELSSRYPRAAGEALYVREGFDSRTLSRLVGFGVAVAGIVSSAAITNGFVGYFQDLIVVPRSVAIIGLVALLALLAAWGVGQSVTVAGLLTVVEVGGLVMVIWACRSGYGNLPARLPDLIPDLEPAVWSGILIGSFLAFYAFIGFEDMVNVAEEATDAPRNMPLAIIVTLVLTLAIYLSVAVGAVLMVRPADLAASGAPLSLVFERGGGNPEIISVIGVLAVINGALIQIIMASRVLYGMADQGLLPAALARVHPRTRTPLVATVAVALAILVLALAFDISGLARATSFITLTIFATVNLALVLIKRRGPAPAGARTYPAWVPWCGFAVSFGFLLMEGARRLMA